MNFLFYVYLIGLTIAVYQDYSRREIDDWLNLFLFFSGIGFLILTSKVGFSNIESFGFFIFISCLLSFLFYYARVFSGGDSKLFFAMSPILFTQFFEHSIINIIVFVLILFCSGSVYSLIYSGVLFFRDFNKTGKAFVFEIKKTNYIFLIMIGIIFFVIGFFKKIIFMFSFLILLFVFLMCFARSLEKISMKKLVTTKQLREGDWLFDNIKIGSRVFESNWEGLSLEEISFLNKFNKKVFIKDGIPYAPSFLIALIIYYFYDYFLGMMFS